MRDRPGAGPLLGDAWQVAWSHPPEHVRGMGMRHCLTVQPKVVVRPLASPGREPDETALDDDKTLALREVQGPQEVRRRQAADLGREVNVELVAQDGQTAHHPGCGADIPIHPHRQ